VVEDAPVAAAIAGALADAEVGADVDAAAGAEADDVADAPADRCATGAGELAWVSGLADGVTVAAGATAARVRTGAAGSGSAQASSAAQSTAAGAAWRWSWRVGIGADEVRLGTAASLAITSPGGADGPASWPSGETMGGSGRCPGTASRNGFAGATTGGPATVRWIGGRDAHAPVGAAARNPAGGAGSEDGEGAAAGPSGVAVGPSDGALRPNGQGRRTGL
jgi:hypothetical protein